MKTTLTLFLLIAILFFRCANQEEKIINPADYAIYLERTDNETLRQCNEEIGFWSAKLNEVKDSEVGRLRLAGMLSSRFMITGEIKDIKEIKGKDKRYILIVRNDQFPILYKIKK